MRMSSAPPRTHPAWILHELRSLTSHLPAMSGQLNTPETGYERAADVRECGCRPSPVGWRSGATSPRRTWTGSGWPPGATTSGCAGLRSATPDDHVHVVATCGGHPGPPGRAAVFPRNDFYRAGEASRIGEARYRLTTTAASDRTAAKRPTDAEQEKSARRGHSEPVRTYLRRPMLTGSACPRRAVFSCSASVGR